MEITEAAADRAKAVICEVNKYFDNQQRRYIKSFCAYCGHSEDDHFEHEWEELHPDDGHRIVAHERGCNKCKCGGFRE